MHEELKARLLAWTKTSSRFGLDSIGKDIAAALEAIDELERQLAERDAEIGKLIEAVADHVTVRAEQYVELQKYRDAPVVAYLYKYRNFFGDDVWTTDHKWGERWPLESKPLIVKPGE